MGIHDVSGPPGHSKVRFGRSDTPVLCRRAKPALAAAPRTRRRTRRLLAIGGGSLVLCACLVASASLLRHDNAWVRAQAEQAVMRMLGPEHRAAIASMALSYHPAHGLVVDVAEVVIASRLDDRPVARIDSLYLGVSPFAILSGRLSVHDAHLAGLNIELDGGVASDRDLLAMLRNDDGLIDPGRATQALFDALHAAFDYVEASDTRAISFSDVTLTTAQGGAVARGDVNLFRKSRSQLAIAAELDLGRLGGKVTGTVDRNAQNRRIDDLDLVFQGNADATAVPQGEFAAGIGALRIAVSGGQAHEEGGHLNVAIAGERVSVRIGKPPALSFDADALLSAQVGSSALGIERLAMSGDGGSVDLAGVVSSDRRTADGADAAYAFHLSDGVVAFHGDDGRPQVRKTLAADLGGWVSGRLDWLVVDEVRLTGQGGHVEGRAHVALAAGRSPGVMLHMGLENLPVAQLRELWPWFAAAPARQWVHANLHDGLVTKGQLDFSVPPGRLGNGIPLNGTELAGTFTLDNARFDVAGDLPGIQDAAGHVAFAGYDIDVGLTQGVAPMRDGRHLALSNGTLVIRHANLRPVIGDLTLDVDGTASDLLDLAGRKPIDAGRFIDFRPDEVTGRAEAHIEAQVPLHGGIDPASLSWRGDIAFTDVSLARPLDGQMVTQASGTIGLDPQAATVRASARLGGALAEIDVVEPIGASTVSRQRFIALDLDDAARRRMFPGLDLLLSGSTRIQLLEDAEGHRSITADIRDATLSLPWIGWQKGPGVPATVSFDMTGRTDGVTRLDNLHLEGESFAAQGAGSLDAGGLRRLDLAHARFNRSDDIAVAVERKAGGHAVRISGERFDARSAIKTIMARTGNGASRGEGGAIELELALAQLAGFHDEVLHDVALSYRGSAGAIDDIVLSARTGSGTSVTARHGRSGDLRDIALATGDAGALLRFMDVYRHMEGGTMTLAMAGRDGAPLRGSVDLRNFHVVDEPRLASIAGGTRRSGGPTLDDLGARPIQASRVFFDTAFTEIEKASGYLNLQRGILRGPEIGASYQGMVYDRSGQIALTGTFMPAYGINRVFGALPLVGPLLGNGRDGGLIGITFRLSGPTADPQLQVNPLSAVAPGIFRSVFEYR